MQHLYRIVEPTCWHRHPSLQYRHHDCHQLSSAHVRRERNRLRYNRQIRQMCAELEFVLEQLRQNLCVVLLQLHQRRFSSILCMYDVVVKLEMHD